LKALGHVHETGFVHCDIKPENILVPVPNDLDLGIWLADFGLVRPIKDAERHCDNIGTELYASPEIRQKKGCLFHF
jgi:serine/threonine-protein kinase